ncbi:MAG: response regulator [Oscillospiraceae bacterium]|nr:response regulator [Oscillospiraceae bacterium]
MLKFVVVEDEQKTRSGLVRLIQKLKPSYECAGEAANGVDGLALIRSVNPHVVITDIKMPLMSGIDMLTQLKEDNLQFKPIILSGYADFEYARTAIKIGVCDYLLKPITVESLQELLDQIELDFAMQENSFSEDSLRSMVRELFNSPEDPDEETLARLSPHLSRYDGLFQIAVQLRWKQTRGDSILTAGNNTEGLSITEEEHAALNQIYQSVSAAFSEAGVACLPVLMPEWRNVVVLYEGADSGDACALLEKALHMDFSGEAKPWSPIAGAAKFDYRTAIQCVAVSTRLLRWALVLGGRHVLTKERVAAAVTTDFAPPSSIERDMIQQVCAHSYEGAVQVAEDFQAYCAASPFQPSSIVEAYVSLVSAVLSKCRELEYPGHRYINQSRLLHWFIDCYSLNDMHDLVLEMLLVLFQDEEQQYGLVVKKAMRMISQNYNKGITLENVAAALNITPVYLSTVFSKETGQPFSNYLTQFRINKAKSLLLTGNHKIYEIAEMVGYSDAKYFCKVFKKITGMSTSAFLQQIL